MKHLLYAGLVGFPLLTQAQSFGPSSQFYIAGAQLTSLATADFNNDGYPDVVTAESSNRFAIDVLLGAPGNMFAPAVRYPSTTAALLSDVTTGDLNKDGYPDIVYTNVVGRATVLLNNKNGTFAPEIVYSTGTVMRGVALGDVNNDGYLDIVSAQDDFYTVAVLLNNKNGTFGTASTYPTGTARTLDVAVADVNNDGYADIAAATLAGQVGVLLNNKTGGFAPLVLYAANTGAPTYGVAIAVSDLDKDGYADLAASNYNTNTVAVLRGNKNGTFGAASLYSTGPNTNPTGLAVGDFNGDNYPDLVTGNGTTSTVSVLLNNRAGAFAPVVQINQLVSSSDVAVADVNKDGKPDILTANGGYGSVSLLLNQTVLAATAPALVQARISVFPNPATDAATLAVTGLSADVRQLDAVLTDAVGRVVRQQFLPAAQGLAQGVLPTGGLAPGVYLLQLTGRDAQGVASRALPVQHVAIR